MVAVQNAVDRRVLGHRDGRRHVLPRRSGARSARPSSARSSPPQAGTSAGGRVAGRVDPALASAVTEPRRAGVPRGGARRPGRGARRPAAAGRRAARRRRPRAPRRARGHGGGARREGSDPLHLLTARMTVTPPHTRRRTDALPPSATFDAWRAATGEGPPDFDRLRPRPDLWCPSAGLSSPAGWPGRRAAIRARWRRWLLGAMPPAPAALYAEEVGHGAERLLRLRPAGPTGPVLQVRLLLPAGTDGARPRAADPDPPRALGPRGPGARAGPPRSCPPARATTTWPPSPPRSRAWTGPSWRAGPGRSAARSTPCATSAEVDATRVVVGGHAEDGKAALVAAAHDERFAAVGLEQLGRARRDPRPPLRGAPRGRGRRGAHAPPPGLVPPAPALLRRPRGPAAHRRARAAGLRRAAAAAAVGRPARPGREHRRGRAAVAAVRPTWELLGGARGAHAALARRRPRRRRGDAAGAPRLGRPRRARPRRRAARPRGPARRRLAPLAGVAGRPAARAGGPGDGLDPALDRPRARRPRQRAVAAPARGRRGPTRPRRRTALLPPPGRGRRRRAGRDGDGRRGRRRPPPPPAAGDGRRPAPLVLWLPPLCRAAGYRGGDAETGRCTSTSPATASRWPATTRSAPARGWPRAPPSRRATRAGRRWGGWSPTPRPSSRPRPRCPAVDGGRVLLAGYGTGALVAAHLLALSPGRDRRRARGAVGRRAAAAPRLRGSAGGPRRPPGHRRRPPRARALPARGVRPAARSRRLRARRASSTRRSTTTTASRPGRRRRDAGLAARRRRRDRARRAA